MKIITTTGTKGKTTITHLLNYVLLGLGYSTLSTDTERIYLNGKLQLSAEMSLDIRGLLPTVCPGKALGLGYDLKTNQWQIDYAVLEASISSYHYGLGYQYHHIGIFTNVFGEHIGTGGVKNQKDLAYRKAEYISKIDSTGQIVINVEDPLIMQQSQFQGKQIIAVCTDKASIQETYTTLVEVKDKQVGIFSVKGNCYSYSLHNNRRSFYGENLIANLNIGFVFAGLYGLLGETIFDEKYTQIGALLDTYSSPLDSGRNIQISYGDREIILDYAHEKYSMCELLKFAQKLKKTRNNKVIAVVRLAPDKAESTYIESGVYISPYAENFIVYDKIDGIERKSYQQEGGSENLLIKPGYTMELFAKGIKKKNASVNKILYRKDAMKKAIEESQAGDVVVIIVNDPIKTGEYIKNLLQIT